MHCAQCRERLTSGARFCAQCGAPVAPVNDGPAGVDGAVAVRHPAAPAAVDAALRAERRHLTVMFCDLVGSTALSTRLDPEDLGQLLVDYREICLEATRRWDGLVASFAGDGVMVYFGYPLAHEDDPERAVLSAHQILREIAAFNARPDRRDDPLAVRIGISSGLVVIGDIGSGEVLQNRGVVGEAPNLAARIQSRAGPGEVLVSDVTHALLDEAFARESLGGFTLAGIDRPVTLYRVADTAPPAERFLRLRRRGLAPIVGRAAESERLLAAWERARSGESVAIGLYGDAGVGKSRLCWALRERLESRSAPTRPHRTLVLNCSPWHSSAAWHPWLDAYVERFGRSDRSDGHRLRRLLRRLTRLEAAKLDETVDALQALLRGERTRADDGSGPTNPVRDALSRTIVGLAAEAPLLLLIEDVHWIDPSTADSLARLVRECPHARLMLLLTSRQRETLEALSLPEIVPLTPLDETQSRELMRAALGARAIPTAWLERLTASSDGNPLHIEELARHVRETGLWLRGGGDDSRAPLDETGDWLPTSLRALFVSRLDRLESGKGLLQTAAVLGRRFPVGLLHRLRGGSADDLARTLRQLSADGLIAPVVDSNRELYEFHHALLRDAAYRSMLLRDRRRLHRAVTRALLEEDERSLETRPELLALHHTRGGERDLAVDAWCQAGLRAQRLSANTEAVAHFQQALDLVGDDGAPETLERRLSLLIRQGPSMMAVRSWASVDVERLYHEIIRICQPLRDDSRLFVGYRGLWGTAMLRGQMDDAIAIAGTLAALAEKLDNPALRLEARMCRAANRFWLGDIVACEAQMTRVMEDYDPALHGPHAYRFSVDPGVLSRFYLAIVRWYRGDAARADRLMRQAVSLAHRQQHYPSLTWALGFQGWLALLRDIPEETRRVATRSEWLCRTHDLSLYGAWATVLLGAADLIGARDPEGIERLERGIDVYRGMGAGVALPVFLSLRARGELALDEPEAALASLAEASRVARRRGIGIVTADIWCLRARALALSPRTSPSRLWRCLRVARAVAERQGKTALRDAMADTARSVVRDEAQARELASWMRANGTARPIA